MDYDIEIKKYVSMNICENVFSVRARGCQKDVKMKLKIVYLEYQETRCCQSTEMSEKLNIIFPKIHIAQVLK